MRFVAYKQYFRGCERQRVGEPRVGARVRLGASECTGVQGDFKMVRESDHGQIGIAVGEGCQPKAALEFLERRNHVGVRFELIARGVPEREGLVRHLTLVTHRFAEPGDGFAAKIRKIVCLVRLFPEQGRANLGNLRSGEVRRNARVSRLEPIGENALGTRQHRLDFPERVVEVETDRAYRAERHGANDTWGGLVDEMLLTMGNKNYSSWSLRPWILMKHLGIAFDERVLPLDTPEFSRDIESFSPTKRVPVLRHGSLLVWDSLAICEYVCEIAGRGWPRERAARAVARSACAEMHSGFSILRSQWPMNARATDRRTAPSPERSAEIARIEQLWTECLTCSDGGGPWLFGEYSVADAMYAPIVLRLRTYGAQVREPTAAYMATVLDDEPMRDWLAAASAESWIQEPYEIGRHNN